MHRAVYGPDTFGLHQIRRTFHRDLLAVGRLVALDFMHKNYLYTTGSTMYSEIFRRRKRASKLRIIESRCVRCFGCIIRFGNTLFVG